MLNAASAEDQVCKYLMQGGRIFTLFEQKQYEEDQTNFQYPGRKMGCSDKFKQTARSTVVPICLVQKIGYKKNEVILDMLKLNL